MKREERIQFIENLWPPDSSGDGREMLMQAICKAWRSMPDEVIEELYDLEHCKEYRDY